MRKFYRSNQKIIDPVTRHIVFEQCRVLHDSLDSLSSEDDRRQITRLIARFVHLVGVVLVTFTLALCAVCVLCFLCECFLRLTVVFCNLQVDHGLDLEQHLAFLVDCRATFGNMDLLRVMFFSLVARLFYSVKMSIENYQKGMIIIHKQYLILI